ncbi:uncharacterized protein G2W53_006027 [Senna tora]|uniref:Uncharacterized protein n=1 Tax=Senna tora TaxID=362788 RepID=A0A834X3U3_9FABA|nr:uncharacterized protein G2W53_006027 [Senna tora]
MPSVHVTPQHIHVPASPPAQQSPPRIL